MRLSISGTWLGLPQELVSELLGRATSHQLKAGDTLFQIGDVGDGCYRLDKGMLKVTLTSSQAEERIVAVLASGAIVGDLAMIDGLPRSASVIAVTDCELRFVSRTAFQHLARHHPEIYRHLVEVLAARLREADETIASLAFLTVKGRVARTLLELAENLGEQTDSSCNSGTPRVPSKRTCRDGWGRPRECKSDLERLRAEKARDQIGALLSDRG